MIHQLISKRFNKNNLLFMATSYNNTPYIRSLTVYYENGSFYCVTDKTSSKMKHLEANPTVALAGYFFNSHAKANIIGALKEHPILKEKLKEYCNEWFILGNIDEDSDNTIILELKLTKGYMIENNQRHDFDF